jgi:hypothetical protein
MHTCSMSRQFESRAISSMRLKFYFTVKGIGGVVVVTPFTVALNVTE